MIELLRGKWFNPWYVDPLLRSFGAEAGQMKDSLVKKIAKVGASILDFLVAIYTTSKSFIFNAMGIENSKKNNKKFSYVPTNPKALVGLAALGIASVALYYCAPKIYDKICIYLDKMNFETESRPYPKTVECNTQKEFDECQKLIQPTLENLRRRSLLQKGLDAVTIINGASNRTDVNRLPKCKFGDQIALPSPLRSEMLENPGHFSVISSSGASGVYDYYEDSIFDKYNQWANRYNSLFGNRSRCDGCLFIQAGEAAITSGQKRIPSVDDLARIEYEFRTNMGDLTSIQAKILRATNPSEDYVQRVPTVTIQSDELPFWYWPHEEMLAKMYDAPATTPA
jgi:hypothetical protein